VRLLIFGTAITVAAVWALVAWRDFTEGKG